MNWPDEDDIKCGKCSGIPECCVNFFITVWKPLHIDDKLPYLKVMDNSEKDQDIHYIPCPECLENKRFVTLLPCDKECAIVKELNIMAV